ncbi:MAG TPA: hypothetical protein VKB04_08995 [Anaerolineales bacterium]|nr:hypothetical protein [Anaerolineales bacterium]
MPRNYQNESPVAFQRLPEYQRDDEWIRAFLREARVGHIASTQNGQPFLNPSTFWFDEATHQIVCGADTLKYREQSQGLL